jgi:site-specific recombinase XerD
LAPIIREAVKDRSYVTQTGLGRDVDHFLTYFKTERGKTDTTCTSYEYCLARLAVYYADLTLGDLDGKHGTNLIRDFLREHYADVTGGTWNTRVATLKAFFKWAFEEGADRDEPDRDHPLPDRPRLRT